MTTPCGKCTNCPCGVNGSIATTGQPQQARSQPPPVSPPPQQQPLEDLSYLQGTPPQQYQQQQYQQQLPAYQQQQYEQPLYQSTLLPQESIQQQEVRYQQPPPPLPPPQGQGGSCQGYCERYPQGQGYPPEQCSIQRYPQAQSPGYHADQSSLQGYPQPQPVRQAYPMAQSQQFSGGQQSPPYAAGQSPQYSQPQVAYAQGPPQQPPAQKQIEVASCVAPTLQVERKKRPSMSCSCVKNRTRNTKLATGGRNQGGIPRLGPAQPDLPIADTYTCTRPPRPSDEMAMPGQQEQLRCNCHEKKKTECHCAAPVKPTAKQVKEAKAPGPPPTHAFVGCGQPYAGPTTYHNSQQGRKCGHCSTKKKCVIQ